MNNCRIVQLDVQDQKGERSEKIVPVHALSTLVSLALQGDSEESEEEEEIDEMELIMERIDEGYPPTEAADFDSNLCHSMREFEFPEVAWFIALKACFSGVTNHGKFRQF